MSERTEQIRQRTVTPCSFGCACCFTYRDDVPYLLAEVAALGERLRHASERVDALEIEAAFLARERDETGERLRVREAQQARLRSETLEEAAQIADVVERECQRYDWIGRQRAIQIAERIRAALAGTGAPPDDEEDDPDPGRFHRDGTRAESDP